MADVTQSLTALIVSKMNPDRDYTENEQQIFMYGMELILNSLLKVSVYLLIGFLSGKSRETLAALFIFGGLRKFSGGKHAKTNLGCFIITGSILALGVGIPYALHLPEPGYILTAIIIWGLYARFAPCDQYYKDEKREREAKSQKIKTLVVLGALFTTGYFQNSYWQMLILCISLLQGITLIELKNP